jgi:hypothetical protein
LTDEVGQPQQRVAAVRGPHMSPSTLERRSGGPHGQVDIGGIGLRHPGEELLRRRIQGVEGAAGQGRHPLAIDQQILGPGLDIKRHRSTPIYAKQCIYRFGLAFPLRYMAIDWR